MFLYVGLPSPRSLGLNEEIMWLVSESCAATSGADESRKSAVSEWPPNKSPAERPKSVNSVPSTNSHRVWCLGFDRGLFRPRASLVENLFLGKQLAFYQERNVRPRRLSDSARLSLLLWARWFDWRNAENCLLGPPIHT